MIDISHEARPKAFWDGNLIDYNIVIIIYNSTFLKHNYNNYVFDDFSKISCLFRRLYIITEYFFLKIIQTLCEHILAFSNSRKIQTIAENYRVQYRGNITITFRT